MKIAVLLLLAREAQWPEALDWLAVAARSNSERAAAKDCVGNRFWLSGCLEQIESLRRGTRRGRGSGSSVITCTILYQISCKPIDSIVMDITFRLDSAARFPDLTG